MTQKTIGPSKLVIARPISAPYSSWMLRSDSGEPSKPERLARTTSGRLPLAALMARAVFFDERGNSVPAVHWSGPSAGWLPRRGIGRDSTPRTHTGWPPRWASRTTEVSASAIPAHRSRTGWSWSVTARMTVRMSKAFLRSGFVSAEKTSPTVVNSLSGCVCGKERTSRSRGSSVCAGRGQRSVEVRRRVLRLAVGAHPPVVAADAEVVLGRHPAGVVQGVLAGEHHRAVRGHDQDALGVHEHRGLGVPVRLGADVDPGDDDFDLPAGLGELDDPAQRPGDPVHVLRAAVHGDARAGGQREPLDRDAALLGQVEGGDHPGA